MAEIRISSYTQLAEGKKERFSYINRTAWHQAGGPSSGKKPEDFTEWVEVEFQPLPHLEAMPVHKREEYIRRELRKIEHAEDVKRVREQRPPITRNRLLKIDPRQRPKTQPKRTPKPLCHYSSESKRDEYKQEFRTFWGLHREDSGQFLTGTFSAEFPKGSFRPPLIDVCDNPMRC